MASIINASTSGVGGVITTADNSGDLNIQSGGSTKIAVTSAGVAVTGLSKASLPTGSVLQVVSANYSTETTNNTTTYADTGLSASITPTSATSKILVIVSQQGKTDLTASGYQGAGLRLLRGATVVFTNARNMGINAAVGVASRSATESTNILQYLDSPATTSSTTYKTQFNTSVTANSGYATVQTDNNPSTITLMEIAA